MFRRSLSLLISFLILTGGFALFPLHSFAQGTEIAEEAAALEVAESGVSIPSESEFVAILNTLRQKYPAGGRYSGVYYEDGMAKAWTCHGYAVQMLYDVFGIKYYSGGYFQKLDRNFGTIYAGDLVRIDGDSHSVFITKVENGKIWYTDANVDNANKIAWDTVLTVSELRSRFTYKMHLSGNTLTGTGRALEFDPVDVGDDFYANIINLASEKAVTVSSKNAQIAPQNGDDYQKWHFERQDDVSYQITNAATGLCLDVADFSSQNGANIGVAASNGGAAQQWYFKSQGEGYSIVPKCAVGSCLDLPGGVTDDGTNVQLYQQNASAAQIYSLNTQPSFTALNLGASFVAEIIHNASSSAVITDSASNVLVDTFDGSLSQQWRFTRYDDRSYKIENAETGLCLDDVNYGTKDRSNIHVWSSNDSSAQRWFILRNGSGFTLAPKCAVNKVMDLYGGVSGKDSNLELWSYSSGNMNQIYSLRYELSPDRTETFGGNRYELYDISIPWQEAYRFCERQGGHLLTINSEQEQQFVFEMVTEHSQKSYSWLGACDALEEGVWKWITGTEITYDNWAQGEPNDFLGEDLMLMDHESSLWNDITDIDTQNEDRFAFICEYEENIDPSEYTYEKVFDFEGHRYEVYTDSVDWQTARLICERKGGHLMTVNTIGENNEIFSQVQGLTNDSYWMGLSDIDVEGRWSLLNDETSTCGNWADGEPNNYFGLEHCAEFVSATGRWNDIRGYSGVYLNIGFICEYNEISDLPKVYIIGDADLDGAVTVMDATAVQRYLAFFSLRAFDERAADVDLDQSVTVLDASGIQKHLAKLIAIPHIGRSVSES